MGGVSRALLAIAACVAAVIAVAACVDLNALTTGNPTADASTVGRDATSDARLGADGRPDAPDAKRPPDAGTDAPLPTDATSPSCPGHPDALLCDDFDDGPFGPEWSVTVARANLTLSSAQASSPPRSLLADIYGDAGTTTGEANAALVFQIPHAVDKIRNTFDVYFDQIGSRSAAIGSVYANDGPLNYEVAVFARGGGAELDLFEDGELADGGEYSATHMFYSPIPKKTWTRLIMDVDFNAPATVTITLETPPGTPALPLAPIPIKPTNAPVTMSVNAGVEFVVLPETVGWRVYVDDVLIEAL